MDKFPTYLLTSSGSTSNQYYNDISEFASEVTIKMDETIGNIVQNFQSYIRKSRCELVRSKDEYEIELLMLGILWKEYIRKAIILKNMPSNILVYLYDQRNRRLMLKNFLDYVRGFLKTFFLLTEDKHKEEINKNLENMNKLVMWLQSSGDFSHHVVRLRQWIRYFETQSNKMVSNCISVSVNLARWFEEISLKRLGIYTKGVDEFLTYNYKKHKWKEDIIYCGSRRVEYHLNMVGAEIMNKAFRSEFLKTKEKRVLLPACMRFNNSSKCKAYRTSDGYVCSNCTAICNVNKLSKMGEKHNFKVYIIPHESTPFTQKKPKAGQVGIVGIACVLNLISGGWKAKDFGFIPQCVLLNYCGCKKHWDKNGIMTEINISKLKEILEITKK